MSKWIIILLIVIVIFLLSRKGKETEDAGVAKYTLPPQYGISYNDCQAFCNYKKEDGSLVYPDACDWCEQHPELMTQLTMYQN